MIAGTPCPCCGHKISETDALRWNSETRTLSGRGHIVQLSPIRGRIFDKLWRLWPSGHMISTGDMTSYIYADDPNGGPESVNTISVHINFIQRDIAPFGLNIKSRHGYLIYCTEQVAA